MFTNTLVRAIHTEVEKRQMAQTSGGI